MLEAAKFIAVLKQFTYPQEAEYPDQEIGSTWHIFGALWNQDIRHGFTLRYLFVIDASCQESTECNHECRSAVETSACIRLKRDQDMRRPYRRFKALLSMMHQTPFPTK